MGGGWPGRLPATPCLGYGESSCETHAHGWPYSELRKADPSWVHRIIVAAYDFRDERLRDAELGSNLPLVGAISAHANDFLALRRRQASRRPTNPLPVLSDAIQHVLAVRPNPQVSRVHAWRVVARMAHFMPVRDGSVDDLPHQPMRTPGTTLTANGVTVEVAVSASLPIDDSGPQPASIIDKKAAPKAVSLAEGEHPTDSLGRS